MANNFIQPGERITLTPTANLTSGQVVSVGKILGIALGDIPANTPGELAVTGVWLLPKVAGSAIAPGDALYWDVSAGGFTATGTPATGDVSGVTWATTPAASADLTVSVRLTGGIGTVAA
jgi:predicted RecA/RadA family phage recombinase